MAHHSTLAQSRPRRKPRIRYTNDDSDSDHFLPLRTQSSRPARGARQDYRESSDDESDGSTESSNTSSEPSSTLSLPQPSQKYRVSARLQSHASHKKRNADDQARIENSFNSYKRQKFLTNTPKIVKLAESPINNDRIPPWQQLPYEALRNIMNFAAYPLYGPRSTSTPSIDWLCATSTLCKSFHEACMAALLYSPPIYPAYRGHGLIALLRQGRNKPFTDYRAKIKSLDIEIGHLLKKKSGIDLELLIANTPLLRNLRLYHNSDELTNVDFNPTSDSSRGSWAYPPELFDKLDQLNIFLQTFEWNGRFPNPMTVLELAVQVHTRPCLSRVQNMTLLNLAIAEKKSSEIELTQAQGLLTSALQKLTDLRHLSLRCCRIIDTAGIMCIPEGLESLELSNCSQLTSAALKQLLSLRGRNLTTLRLLEHHSMSLEFLTDLKSSCPRLQVLEIDFLYTDSTAYDLKEEFELSSLCPTGPPTWPTSLVTISMDNVRYHDIHDAERFLSSLVDASDDLPHLKKLSIKAILKKSSWRDRATLRKKWLSTLENIFLDTSQPIDWTVKSTMTKPAPRAVQRQSTRLARSNANKSSSGDTTDDSDATTSVSRHARCCLVDLVISDQRPTRDQFHEDDFLDDEPTDDDEWNGDDQDDVHLSTAYAW
ncbi:hypothetical protein LTR84_010828 [Exophiala bonariae]|uniref:F-box domain-containing protein n=1 Tax=Exophiala bonariae TaxID=1690606 RepID=A0AAV9NHH6_9EURO|nr:hypothetical protein LTR84_010828 [Exophiala bonariae]